MIDKLNEILSKSNLAPLISKELSEDNSYWGCSLGDNLLVRHSPEKGLITLSYVLISSTNTEAYSVLASICSYNQVVTLGDIIFSPGLTKALAHYEVSFSPSLLDNEEKVSSLLKQVAEEIKKCQEGVTYINNILTPQSPYTSAVNSLRDVLEGINPPGSDEA